MGKRTGTSIVFSALAFASALVTTLPLACSSSPERTGFTTDSQAPTEPIDTEPDASPSDPKPSTRDGGPTEPDTCERTPPSNKCGLVPQCGCTPAQTCDVVDEEGNVRCVAAGKAPMGHPCTATVGCQRGLSCLFGTCHAFCGTAGSACSETGAGQCVQVQSSGGVTITNLKVCRVKCAPHDPASCGGVTNAGAGACVVDNDGATDCQTAGVRRLNETCGQTQGDCVAGHVCVTPSSGPSICKRWCRVGKTDCGSATCRGFQTPLEVDGVAYGTCS